MNTGFPESLTPVSEVVDGLLRAVRLKKRVVRVGLSDAVGMVAAADVRARFDVPPYDRSLLDGYAARHEDVAPASPSAPVVLKVRASVRVHEAYRGEVGRGEAVEVATGSPLPRGSDVVIPYEHAVRSGDEVIVYRSYPRYYGVSKAGEDVRRGEVVLRRGELVRPWHLGLLAAQGLAEVEVFERLRVAVFDTGDELVEPGGELEEGKVYDSTRYLVKGYLRSLGLDVIDLGIVSDDPASVKRAFAEALQLGDIVVSIGGTSVGRRDHTVKVLRALEAVEYFVHGVALTPGRPAAVATVGGKPVFALSGMPVAALTELQVIFREFYRRFMGLKGLVTPVAKARLLRRVASDPGMVTVYRVRVCTRGGELYAEPLRLTGSGVLSTLIRGNALLIVGEEETGFDEGDEVTVELLSEVGECE